MSIPVLGVPVINVPHFIARLVDSINVPVDNLVFVHNRDEGQPNEEVSNLLRKIQASRPAKVDKVHVHTFRRNMGVSAAWNMIMLLHTAPWYLICNSDIAFQPPTLPHIIQVVDVRAPTCVWRFGIGMSAFAIANHTRHTTGTFDENYYPAYSEDCDYFKRLAITHCPSENVADMNASGFVHARSASWRLSRHSKLYERVRQPGAGFNNWDYLARRFGTNSCDEHWSRTPKDPTTWQLDTQRRLERGGPDACVACGTYQQELLP